jgi:hypothetical protein
LIKLALAAARGAVPKIIFSVDSYRHGTLEINADGTDLKRLTPDILPELSRQRLPTRNGK